MDYAILLCVYISMLTSEAADEVRRLLTATSNFILLSICLFPICVLRRKFGSSCTSSSS